MTGGNLLGNHDGGCDSDDDEHLLVITEARLGAQRGNWKQS